MYVLIFCYRNKMGDCDGLVGLCELCPVCCELCGKCCESSDSCDCLSGCECAVCADCNICCCDNGGSECCEDCNICCCGDDNSECCTCEDSCGEFCHNCSCCNVLTCGMCGCDCWCCPAGSHLHSENDGLCIICCWNLDSNSTCYCGTCRGGGNCRCCYCSKCDESSPKESNRKNVVAPITDQPVSNMEQPITNQPTARKPISTPMDSNIVVNQPV